ncbi:hypothetical protein AGMMS49546_25910 [Spirochaetia bacterium]|nr:hypothetical protein AGMMS49546_25910 [Spirochaetia bacterium]
MDLTGFLDSIVDYVDEIGMGRKGLATDSEEHAGRIHYERGISGASNAFHEAQNSADPQIIVLSELVFLQQELQFCNEADAGYKIAEKTYPQNPKYRIQGFPKDAADLWSDSSCLHCPPYKAPQCPAFSRH